MSELSEPAEVERAREVDRALCVACLAGEAGALRLFEAEVMPVVAPALARLRFSAPLIAEVEQRLRAELFLEREGGRPPMLASFRGTGWLRSWLRIAAIRIASRMVGKARLEVPLPDEALDGLLPPADPELTGLKAAYRGVFREAFLEALESLEPRERTLLLQHHLDGVGIDALAPIHRVHRATIARWIARSRELLLERTRARMSERLGLPAAELDSVLRLIQSRMSFTIRSVVDSG
jgi:RNA polymerase sigma-70 factor (ECF subfamily)